MLTLLYTDLPNVTIQQASPLLAIEGDTVQLSCVYWGVPSPDVVTWSHNNKQVNGADGRVTIDHDNVSTHLTIASVAKSDTGYYTCAASNELGTSTSSVQVLIQCKIILNSLWLYFFQQI